MNPHQNMAHFQNFIYQIVLSYYLSVQSLLKFFNKKFDFEIAFKDTISLHKFI